MAAPIRESFAGIWRPVFADGCPPESAVADAWARTRALLVQQYGPRLTHEQVQSLLTEMVIAWLLRALSPSATAADTELASLAQQAALWLGALRFDLDRVYEGYYPLLQAWGVYR